MTWTGQSTLPSPGLRRYVRAFAQRNAMDASMEQRMPAYLETVLHFDFGDLLTVHSPGGRYGARRRSIVGPHTRGGVSLRFDGDIDTFAIFLQPSALWYLFRVPVSDLMEAHYDADDVIGNGASRLWNTLAATTDFNRRVEIAEQFLAPYAGRAARGTTISSAATILAREGGRITVPGLASRVQLSVRQLERSFIREIGITPKRFARVARFQAALDARVTAPHRSWLEIATETGYFDQMHLIHEFQSLGGSPPTNTLKHLGDSRPDALAASHEQDTRAQA